MHISRFSIRSVVTVLAGVAAGASLGCIITTNGGGSNECGSLLSHSHEVNGGADCRCDAGYTWEDPDDPDNYSCEEIEGKGSGDADCNNPHNYLQGNTCYCDVGFNWCAPTDPNDYTCCEDPAQDAASGTDTNAGTDTATSDDTATGGTGSGSTSADGSSSAADSGGTDTGVTPDPADCTPDSEGAVFCSNAQADGPGNSHFWTCMGGEWVEMPSAGDESCMFDGYDFAYGCIDDGSQVAFICGNGPGTACDGSTESSCVDMDVVNTCLFGRLTEDSCARICNEIGDDMGVTYDSGFCDAAASPPDCFCCDAGEEGCPA
ncbi:MAG: hypothetical protein K1X88_23120 [Nannocystaceae bacterium]|nr:hypothetical protein [Nannocystaceae bacterium]